jgi:hypothetical protein
MSFRLVAALAVSCLVACTQMQVDGAHVTGLFTPVHADEVRAAIAAANAAQPKQRGRIYEVQVIGTREMHIYREPKTHLVTYQIARKINGRWNADERAIIVTE